MSTYLFKSQIANATNNFSMLFSTGLAFTEMHRRLSSLLKPQYFEVIKVPPTP